MNSGDLGRYQDLNEQASEKIAEALDIYDQINTDGTPTTGATSGSTTGPTETTTTTDGGG